MDKIKVLPVAQGNNAHQYIKLQGKKDIQTEPPEFSIRFPFGNVCITRTSDDEYWVHISTKSIDDEGMEQNDGVIKDARIDHLDKGVNETDCGDLRDPKTYHMAVLLGKK